MKTKLFPVLLVVILVAAVFAFPVLAQGENPPVDVPVFDWAGISSALQTLIIAFLVPSAGFLARWLFAMGSYQKAQLSEQQEYNLNLFIETCVFAAEQMKLKDYISNKLDHVIQLVEFYLLEHRIEINGREIRARIEAVVAKELNFDKLTAPKVE